MGAWTSRQNAGVEEIDVVSNYAYKYPPRCGNYFGSHFIMGGERFDTPQPEAYLFGENADLNFLGSRPIPFPYPPPQANEPTKTLKSLVNIRKESLRFVRAPPDCGKIALDETGVVQTERDVETGKVALFNIEFTFDCDCRCAITIHYFCTEEVTATGVVYTPRDPNMNSETFRYKRGANQQFCQPLHVFDPTRYSEEELLYNTDKEVIPIAIHCVAEEAGDEPRQSHTTIAVVEKHSDGTYVLKALKQKLFVDGLCYLLQEIYGIENKNNDGKVATCDTDDTEDNGSECVICMSDVRDTLILPCRHLCLCNSCADSLRYQANNCPICRAPFRALLQIRALQKTTQRQVPPASPPTNDGSCENIPAGYEAVSLIEALNGPCAPRQPPSAPCELIETPDTEAAVQAAEILNRSALESATDNGSPDESELGKSPRDRLLGGSGSCTTPEFRMSVLLQHDEEGKETTRSPLLSGHRSTQHSRGNKTNRCPGDTLKLINEKLPAARKEEPQDEDSEGEKMSPLLEGENSDRPPHNATALESINDTDTEHDEPTTVRSVERTDTDKHSARKEENVVSSERADDSDYYTPEEPAPMVLSPLYSTGKERERPNTAPPSGGGLDSTESTPMRHPLGASLPGTPLSHVSVRSSGDSYSSSSSTKQLLTIANGNIQDAAASKAMHV